MSSFGVVEIKDIKRMLDACAKGHTVKTTQHHHCVMYNGHTFHTLPLGDHGARKNAEIKGGHVKHMVRQLHIDPNCAHGFFPHLKLAVEKKN